MGVIPKLTDAEVAMLTESIRRDGVKYPVLLRVSGQVIDGHHRRRIAEELGLPCPTVTLDVDDETAERLAVTLNLARRQLSPEQKYELIAWLAQAHEERANSEARLRMVEGGKKAVGRKGGDTVSPPFSAGRQRGPRSRDVIAERINADMAALGLPADKRVSGRTVDRAQRWQRAPEAEKAAARSGRRSATSVVTDPRYAKTAGAKKEAPRKRTKAQVRAEVDRIWGELADAQIRDGLKAKADDSRESRQKEATVRLFERQTEQQQAVAEAEAIKVAKAAADQARKRHEYWDSLAKEVSAFHRTVGVFLREFADLPPPYAAQRRVLDGDVEKLGQALHVLRHRLFPGRDGRGGLKDGAAIITVDS